MNFNKFLEKTRACKARENLSWTCALPPTRGPAARRTQDRNRIGQFLFLCPVLPLPAAFWHGTVGTWQGSPLRSDRTGAPAATLTEPSSPMPAARAMKREHSQTRESAPRAVTKARNLHRAASRCHAGLGRTWQAKGEIIFTGADYARTKAWLRFWRSRGWWRGLQLPSDPGGESS